MKGSCLICAEWCLISANQFVLYTTQTRHSVQRINLTTFGVVKDVAPDQSSCSSYKTHPQQHFIRQYRYRQQLLTNCIFIKHC